MVTIFISHSRQDQEIVRLFCDLFHNTGVEPILKEFEQYYIPPWLDIRGDVQRSSAVYLLLGPGLTESPYTQNWVAWENGVAAALGKETWVYERFDLPVKFPVPSPTHYMLYDPKSREHLDYIHQLIARHDPSPQLWGAALGALAGAKLTPGPGPIFGGILGWLVGTVRDPVGVPVTCPHPNCSIRFQLHTQMASLRCPSCRQPIQLDWGPAG